MMMNDTIPVITIDGPSGTGKGTIGQKLAEHLGWHFLDSGALYRVLAYAATQQEIDFNDVDKLVTLAHNLQLRFEGGGVILSGENISNDIRTEYCAQNASKIAAVPEVREALLACQRAFATTPGLVTDGRDMGTVVFPNAWLKIYLYASTEERAARRFLQLKKIGKDASLAQVVDELAKRDARDTARLCAPLKSAEDAVQIDTTTLTIVQVFNLALQLIDKKAKN